MQKGSVQGLETPSELLDLVQPHIESYDYFLGEGIQRVVEHIDPIEVSLEAGYCARRNNEVSHWLPSTASGLLSLDLLQVEHPSTRNRHRYWFENPIIGRPVKDIVSAGSDERLFPTECREAVSSAASMPMGHSHHLM